MGAWPGPSNRNIQITRVDHRIVRRATRAPRHPEVEGWEAPAPVFMKKTKMRIEAPGNEKMSFRT